jgi:hypothetical protein
MNTFWDRKAEITGLPIFQKAHFFAKLVIVEVDGTKELEENRLC